MLRTHTFFTGIACLAAMLAGSDVAAQEPSPITGNSEMRQMMRLMLPGEGHTIFATMTGKWTTRMKIWNAAAPEQPPQESTGQSESKLILGGRFLLEDATGSMMRMPMQRLSILGYDNLTKEYTLVFYSNFGTATDLAVGTFDQEGKALILRGVFNEPAGKTPFKNVLRMESDDVHTFESYKVLPNGTELKVIEQVNTRIK